MSPEEFDFELPADRIAQQAEAERVRARMMVLNRAPSPDLTLIDARVEDIRGLLPQDALLVLNNSRVEPARLRVPRARDGRLFELLWCEPGRVGPGQHIRAWVRGAKKLREGDRLEAFDPGVALRYLGPDTLDPRARVFELSGGDLLGFARRQGEIPLPPYIERPDGPDEGDRARYQSTFARADGERGSVAAPTAGLHFSTELLSTLDHVFLSLHVGPGTFLPMDVEDVAEHRVGRESFFVSEDSAAQIEHARSAGRPIVGVGTTVTRTLESLARENDGRVVPGTGSTELVIRPGFQFRVLSGLLTNFHLPRSSLLMLTCAFGGHERVMKAYREAVLREYRFYSYGDCMLIRPGSERS